MYCLQAYTEVRNEHIFCLYVLDLIIHCDYNMANINLITKAVYTHTFMNPNTCEDTKVLSKFWMVVFHSKTHLMYFWEDSLNFK